MTNKSANLLKDIEKAIHLLSIFDKARNGRLMICQVDEALQKSFMAYLLLKKYAKQKSKAA